MASMTSVQNGTMASFTFGTCGGGGGGLVPPQSTTDLGCNLTGLQPVTAEGTLVSPPVTYLVDVDTKVRTYVGAPALPSGIASVTCLSRSACTIQAEELPDHPTYLNVRIQNSTGVPMVVAGGGSETVSVVDVNVVYMIVVVAAEQITVTPVGASAKAAAVLPRPATSGPQVVEGGTDTGRFTVVWSPRAAALDQPVGIAQWGLEVLLGAGKDVTFYEFENALDAVRARVRVNSLATSDVNVASGWVVPYHTLNPDAVFHAYLPDTVGPTSPPPPLASFSFTRQTLAALPAPSIVFSCPQFALQLLRVQDAGAPVDSFVSSVLVFLPGRPAVVVNQTGTSVSVAVSSRAAADDPCKQGPGRYVTVAAGKQSAQDALFLPANACLTWSVNGYVFPAQGFGFDPTRGPEVAQPYVVTAVDASEEATKRNTNYDPQRKGPTLASLLLPDGTVVVTVTDAGASKSADTGGEGDAGDTGDTGDAGDTGHGTGGDSGSTGSAGHPTSAGTPSTGHPTGSSGPGGGTPTPPLSQTGIIAICVAIACVVIIVGVAVGVSLKRGKQSGGKQQAQELQPVV